MTEVNRRIRELTESMAALERRIGELSEENDRLSAAHAEVFAAHKDERARRQELEAACVCGKTPKDRGFLDVLVSRLAAVPDHWHVRTW